MSTHNISEEGQFCYRVSAGVFLCEALPQDWFEWNEERQEAFVRQNAWQPFQDYQTEDIFEFIASHAYTLKNSFYI